MPFRNAARLTLAAIAFVVFTTAAPITAAAQISGQSDSQISNDIAFYVMPVFTRVSNTTPDPGLYAFLGANQTSQLFSGVGIGVYDQVLHLPALDAGVDLRGSIQKGANAHLNTFLIGARVAFHPSVLPVKLKPYVEVLGGVGGTRAATNPVTKSKGEYGGLAGLDYQLGKYVDLRVIEVGYNSLQTISTAAVTGAAVQPGASTLLNISAGIVFRFPQRIIP